MSTRILIQKTLGTIATLIAGGCNLPNIEQQTKPQQVEVKVVVEDGKITVNDATIDVKSTSAATPSAAVCPCGCNQEDCRCSRSKLASDAGQSQSAGSAPQVVNQPLKIERKKVTFFSMPRELGTCPGCEAGKRDLKAAKLPFDVDYETTQAPPGNQWPVAVWTDASGKQQHWTPPTATWHSGSLSELIAFWRAHQ